MRYKLCFLLSLLLLAIYSLAPRLTLASGQGIPQFQSASPWSQYLYSAERTSRSPNPGPHRLRILWNVSTGSTIPPVVADNRAWIWSSNNRLLCINLTTGSILWQQELAAPCSSSSLLFSAPYLYAATSTKVLCLNASTGASVFSISIQAPLYLLYRDALYVVSDNPPRLYRLTGEYLSYSIDLNTTPTQPPTAYLVEGKPLIVVPCNYSIYGFWGQNGSLCFHSKFTASLATPIVFSQGYLYLATSDGFVYALYARNGSIAWAYWLYDAPFALLPTVSGEYGAVLAVGVHGTLYVIDESGLQTIGSLNETVCAVAAADYLYIGLTNGTLTVVQPLSFFISSTLTFSKPASGIAVYGLSIVVTTPSHTICAVEPIPTLLRIHSPSHVPWGSPIHVFGQLISDQGLPVPSANLSVQLSHVQIRTSTNASGWFSATIPTVNLTAGNYTLIVRSDESPIYAAALTLTPIEVVALPTSITLYVPSTASTGTCILVRGYVRAEHLPQHTRVLLSLQNPAGICKTFVVNVTNGEFTYSFTPLKPGKWLVNVSFPGTGTHLASSASASIEILPRAHSPTPLLLTSLVACIAVLAAIKCRR